jgi:hypothetical protein
MRLIDGDELEEIVRAGLKENMHNDGFARRHHKAEYIHFLDLIRRAPTIAQPPNDPLTEEQLREMDGAPVYLDLGDGGEWVLVRLMENEVYFSHKNTICVPARIAFECGGKVYLFKPKSSSNAE